MADPTPIAELSYEQARDELVQIVARLEAGQLPLGDSLSLWERGEALAQHCQTWLDDAQRRLDSDQGEVGQSDADQGDAGQGDTGRGDAAGRGEQP